MEHEDPLPTLHRAAHLGDLTTVLQLIDDGVCAELADRSGVLTARHHAVLGGHGQLATLLCILQDSKVTDLASAFMLACRKGETLVAEMLLDRGYADTTVGPEGNSGLGEAISENNLETVCSLLKYKQKWPELNNLKGLMLAAWAGSPALFDLLFERACAQGRIDPGVRDGGGRTALHWAVLGGNQEMVEKLLELGISPDQTNVAGNTALHIACMEGHHQLIQPIAAVMENPSAVNDDGFSILMLAAMHGNTEICRQLLQLELVDPNIQDRTENTALHRLASCAEAIDITCFCEFHANPDLRNNRGETVLIRCIRLGNVEAALALLDQNIEVGVANASGQSALHLLSRHHLDVLVEPLIDSGADINARDGQENTPLIQAVLDHSLDTVLALTDELASVALKNTAGKTALDVAQELGYVAIEQVLQEYVSEQTALGNTVE